MSEPRKVNKSVKRESSREDEPMVRVQRQREIVESMKHENEVLRLDLTLRAVIEEVFVFQWCS